MFVDTFCLPFLSSEGLDYCSDRRQIHLFPGKAPVAESLDREIRALDALLGSPRDPQGRAFVTLADACRRAGDKKRAQRLVSEGIAAHPDLASGHVVSAWLQEDLGNPAEAEAGYVKVLELDAENVEALRGLGGLLLARGETAAAGPLVTKLRARDPDAALALATDGSDAEPSDPEALVDAERDTEAGSPESPVTAAEGVGDGVAAGTAEIGSGTSGSDEGDMSEAAEDMAAVQVDDAPTTRTMAEVYAGQGFHDRAIEIYERILLDRPDDEEVARRLDGLRAERDSARPRTLAPDSTDSPSTEEPVDPPPALETEAEHTDSAEQLEATTGPMEGVPIRDYFSKLLEWSPEEEVAEAPGVAAPQSSAEPARERAAETTEGPSPDVMSGGSLASDSVAVESLAPAVAPIESLAPDAVAVESLAPAVVPIESLAPTVVPIESLAPDADPARDRQGQ